MKRLLKRSGIMRILILTCATGGGHLRAAAALEKCGLPLTIRGEALTLEQFAQVANAIVE